MDIAISPQTLDEVELSLRDQKYEEARAVLSQRLAANHDDRRSSLYLLLVNALTNGPTLYEEQIDRLRSLPAFDETEREIVRRIFVLAHDDAVKSGREKQAWSYQRLLRRLLLKLPLSGESGDADAPSSLKEPRLSDLHEISDHDATHSSGYQLSNIFRPLKKTLRLGSLIIGALFGLLLTLVFYFWMAQDKSTAATVDAAPKVESLLKRDARTIAAKELSAQANARAVATQTTTVSEKIRNPGVSMISWDFVMFFIAILFWSLSLFLVGETVRSQKSTLANKAGLPEPFSGVEMSQWISCLIVLLWFARKLFSHPGQDPLQFLLDLVQKPEQLTPGIALAIFPPLIVGIVKLIFALGIARGENEDQPARENRLWVTAVFLALHLACGFGATLLLARFIA